MKNKTIIEHSEENAISISDQVITMEEKIYRSERNSRNRFSIVVACYNNQDYLEDCLSSILKQTYEDIEIIVVDDHSAVFDINRIINYIEKNRLENLSRLVVYQNPNNFGTVKSVNGAIRITLGSYIKSIAADDALYDETVLQKVYEQMRMEDSDIVLFDVMQCDERLNCVEIYQNEFLEKVNYLSSEQIFKKLCIRNRISAASVFFKKSFFEKYGYFDEKYRLLEDWPTWLRYVLNDGKLVYKKIVTTKYRVNAGVVGNCNVQFLMDRKKVFYDIIKPQKKIIGRVLYYKALISANIISSVPLRKTYIKITSFLEKITKL